MCTRDGKMCSCHVILRQNEAADCYDIYGKLLDPILDLMQD